MNTEILDRGFVSYEDFGAKGDGETNDLEAIFQAHVFANRHRLPVRTRWDATYYIGDNKGTALTRGEEIIVPVETDTDWGSSHFVIDDRNVTNHKVPVFLVRSVLPETTLPIEKLQKDQKRLPFCPETDCFVSVKNDHIRRFIRFGPNVNDGTPQSDVFILRKDGSIDSPIDWDYEEITELQAFPIDPKPLVIEGGIFTTIANQGPSIYDYYERNIQVTRSNTTVRGIVHYVAGELSHGSPYNGFIRAFGCADILFEDLFSTGHKMYYTIGSAGVLVPMGSYDLRAGRICNFTMINCRTNNILDRSRWGTIATDFCKNIRLRDCVLSRIDTHQGVSGVYELKNCTFGHMGIKAIGRGKLLLDHVTSYGYELLEFRPDYGSVWDGTVEILDSRYIPACNDVAVPYLFHVQNAGIHDFGYPCRMPREIRIHGLEICDTHVPENYEGPYFCSDPDAPSGFEKGPLPEIRPCPYLPPEKITLENVRTASGKKLLLCEDPVFSRKLENALRS